MKVFFDLDELPSNFGATILSVGNFDGVHVAHTHVLKEIALRGVEQGRRSMAVTFEPHPVRVLRPDSGFNLITPATEKLRLLAATGIDATMVLPFTNSLSDMTPETFAGDIVKRRLRADEVHEGYNFRFGNKASGDVELLKRLGEAVGFEVHLYSAMKVRKQTVSSSDIRDLLKKGEVGHARHLLGRTFSIQSTVSHGRGYGSKYTVPTINLAAYPELLPKNGVYITRTWVAGECFDSVTNVGDRPTFGGKSFAVESHLMDFHPLEISGETPVKIHFLKRLRDEIKFHSVEALRDQIGQDIKRARCCFRLLKSNTGVDVV